ncbi:hypothetical protein RHECNPAF_430077 [Rhizobium etli CNPAF512]|nr:hypothetical protein RHECNPAF_430077 [Rhizobium etli CNPAF512]
MRDTTGHQALAECLQPIIAARQFQPGGDHDPRAKGLCAARACVAVRRMNALECQRRLDDGAAAEIGRRELDIIVAENDIRRHGHRQYLGQQSAAETQAGCRHRKRGETAFAQRVPLVEQRHLQLPGRLVVFFGRHAVEAPVDLVAVIDFGDPREFAGQERIVGIEEKEDIPARRVKTGIEARGLAAVFLQHGPNARPVRSEDLPGIIRGAVVDHDHLEVRIVLRQNAVDAWAQELPIIEIVDQHREFQITVSYSASRHFICAKDAVML